MRHSDPYPAVVIGAGPAGISAAMWLDSLNLEHRWFADGEIGGTLHRVYNAIVDFPGLPTDDGAELAEELTDQLRSQQLEPTTGHIARVERNDDHWVLFDDDAGQTAVASARCVILATGTRYRRLGVPGEDEGLGDYVSQSVARGAEQWAEQTVAMVGGGDSGFEGALRLSEQGCRVHLLLRSESRARRDFVRRVRADDDILVHPIPTVVDSIEPLPHQRGARLRVTTKGDPRTLEVACLFVRIGVKPVVPTIQPPPSRDDGGYIQVDAHQRTDRPGLYAAGDVAATSLPAVATAVGDGARAAHTVTVDLGHKHGRLQPGGEWDWTAASDGARHD